MRSPRAARSFFKILLFCSNLLWVVNSSTLDAHAPQWRRQAQRQNAEISSPLTDRYEDSLSHSKLIKVVTNGPAQITELGRTSHSLSQLTKAALHQNGCNSPVVENLVLSSRVLYFCLSSVTFQQPSPSVQRIP